MPAPVRQTCEVDTAAQKVANGKDAFTLTATLRINTVTFFLALWSSLICLGASNRLQTVISWVNADKEGKAELKVVSVTAGTYEITASAGNDQPSNAQSVTFVADKTTATISSIEVIGNRAAGGRQNQTDV